MLDVIPVIGLEIHIQLLSRSKAFCGCATDAHAEENTQCCPVCLGHPGAMPVLNAALPRAAVQLGLATGCSVRPSSAFARKHYFYPDLPKGYQVTQYEDPICHGGTMSLALTDGSTLHIGITRIHMEEDAARMQHSDDATLVDYNRCGVPLLEVVTAPDFHRPEDAAVFLKELRRLVRWLGISDGNMQDGSLRCDANISLTSSDGGKGTRTEIKNLNSIRGVERALHWEIQRQRALVAGGHAVETATLLWDEDAGEGRIMRGKETAVEYHYLTEPDLPPVIADETLVDDVRNVLPELPDEREARFRREYALSEYVTALLCENRIIAEYFEAVLGEINIAETGADTDTSADAVAGIEKDTRAHGETAAEANAAGLVAHFITGEVFRVMAEWQSDTPPVSAPRLAALLRMPGDGQLSSTAMKSVFEQMCTSDESPEEITRRLGLLQITDESVLHMLIAEIIEEHPAQCAQYLEGKEGLFGFFVGRVMQRSKGAADPMRVNTLLTDMFEEMRKRRS